MAANGKGPGGLACKHTLQLLGWICGCGVVVVVGGGGGAWGCGAAACVDFSKLCCLEKSSALSVACK